MNTTSKTLKVFHFSPDYRLPFVIADHDTLFSKEKGISVSKPHRHTFFEVLYYSSGKGTHYIDFIPYPLNPPVFFFISPGQVHFWQVEEPLQGKLILFTEDFLVPIGCFSCLASQATRPSRCVTVFTNRRTK